ncbi:hypothetical protein VTJ49DRAFT_3285 [Mycothermus thermophilus]|uniref:Uncharacterized protein n=1 Tax=Humicola insolens TaxID=85995 RepID=A0ABR3V8W0_HUMIN
MRVDGIAERAPDGERCVSFHSCPHPLSKTQDCDHRSLPVPASHTSPINHIRSQEFKANNPPFPGHHPHHLGVPLHHQGPGHHHLGGLLQLLPSLELHHLVRLLHPHPGDHRDPGPDHRHPPACRHRRRRQGRRSLGRCSRSGSCCPGSLRDARALLLLLLPRITNLTGQR